MDFFEGKSLLLIPLGCWIGLWPTLIKEERSKLNLVFYIISFVFIIICMIRFDEAYGALGGITGLLQLGAYPLMLAILSKSLNDYRTINLQVTGLIITVLFTIIFIFTADKLYLTFDRF